MSGTGLQSTTRWRGSAGPCPRSNACRLRTRLLQSADQPRVATVGAFFVFCELFLRRFAFSKKRVVPFTGRPKERAPLQAGPARREKIMKTSRPTGIRIAAAFSLLLACGLAHSATLLVTTTADPGSGTCGTT